MFTPATFEFFKNHLKQTDTNYFEIGVYNGESIKELGQEFPDKKIIAVDPFIEDGCTTHNSGVERGNSLVSQKETALEGIKDLSNVIFHEMTSEEFYKNLNSEIIQELNIGSVFIDGSHWYDDVVNDYKLALDLIGNKKGVVCFDDLHVEDVSKACEEFKSICGDRIIEKIDLTESNSVFILSEI